jgi:hypothetical protein
MHIFKKKESLCTPFFQHHLVSDNVFLMQGWELTVQAPTSLYLPYWELM